MKGMKTKTMPSTIAPLIVQATYVCASAMLIEAGLPEYEYIVKEKGVFYWRSPMKVDLDVARFMELVREGEEEVDETRKMNLWEKACRLYKGELLPM